MADEKDNWLALARESHTDSTMYFDANVRTQVEQSLRLVQSKHPAGSKYHSEQYKTRSRIFRPKTRAALRKNEAVFAAALFSNEDVVNISAYNTTDEKNLAAAELHQALLQYRLTNSIKWFLTSLGAFQEAQTSGVAISYQYWDYDPKKGVDKPCVELIPIENFRFHPATDWTDPVNSSPYLIQEIPMYVKDVKARMVAKADGEEPAWYKLSDTEILAANSDANDSIRMQRQGKQRQDPTEASTSVSDHQIVWVHRNIIEKDGEDWVFYTLGVLNMLSKPKRLSEVYRQNVRPYVLGYGLIEAHKSYPDSPVFLTKEIQGEINEVANQRIDNVKFAMNKRYFAKRNAQVDVRSLVRNVPSSVTLMNDIEKDVKVVETQDVTASSYKEQEMLNLEFDDLLGMFSSSSVQSNRKLNETVGGMEMLSDSANQITEYGLRVFVETWVEPVLRQLVLLEKNYETDENILMIAGETALLNKKYGVEVIDDDLIGRDVIVSVNVGLGATNPAQQFNKFVTGLNTSLTIMGSPMASKLNTDEITKEIMAKSGYKNSDRFFVKADTEENPELAALQEQVAALQAQLEAKQPQALVDAQVAKLKAETAKIEAMSVETYVKSQFAAMQAGQVVATMPSVAPVADAILDGAGFIPKDGADFQARAQGLPEQPMIEDMPLPTTNEVPALDSGLVGANDGIETIAADSVPSDIISEEFKGV